MSRQDADDIIAGRFDCQEEAARGLEDEIEKRGLQDVYVSALCEIVIPLLDHSHGPIYEEDSCWQWALIRATPEQRAAAFLKVIE